MKRKMVVLLIAVALVAGAIILVKSKMAEIAALPKPEASISAVRAAVAAPGTLEVSAHYQGSVEPVTKSDVSARISGNLLSVAKREGDPVREGEIVAVIDDRELVERSAAVEAEVQAQAPEVQTREDDPPYVNTGCPKCGCLWCDPVEVNRFFGRRRWRGTCQNCGRRFSLYEKSGE